MLVYRDRVRQGGGNPGDERVIRGPIQIDRFGLPDGIEESLHLCVPLQSDRGDTVGVRDDAGVKSMCDHEIEGSEKPNKFCRCRAAWRYGDHLA